MIIMGFVFINILAFLLGAFAGAWVIWKYWSKEVGSVASDLEAMNTRERT